MNLKSKKTSLVLLGIAAVLCSRTLFFFFNDPEGPNLVVVIGLAIVLYLVSFAAYVLLSPKTNDFKRLSIALCMQILSVIGLYFCMK
jgi:hypothetical protein